MGKIGKILYTKVARKSKPNIENSPVKVYAVQQSREVVDLDALSAHIVEHGSPFSKGTIKGILEDTVEHIIELLLDSRRVKLDGLGTVYTTLSCTGAASADSFTSDNIKRVNPRISFDKEVKGRINTDAEFELTSSRQLQAQARKEQGQSVDELVSAAITDNGGEADSGDITP